MKRILAHPALPKVIARYFPTMSLDDFIKMGQTLKTPTDFQAKIISPAIEAILKETSDGLTLTGIENLRRDQSHLFISNHRDIICDPALLTNSLFLNGFSTPKICLGDNLLKHPTTIDLVKMNKGVTVKRNLPIRDLFHYSTSLSRFIHHEIKHNLNSVWIAQREGRSKDGKDITQPGVLKMLTLCTETSFVDEIEALNIVPVAISYEYDPCDLMKARERFIISTQGSYQKDELEDQQSMLAGILQFKGRIHIGIGAPIKLESSSQIQSKKDLITILTQKLDQQISALYKKWPSNYIAHDLLFERETFSGLHYSATEKKSFVDRMNKKLSESEFSSQDQKSLQRLFLESYSNPISLTV